MARPGSTILTSDTGRAQTAALGVLLLLASVQVVLVGRTVWLAQAGGAALSGGGGFSSDPLQPPPQPGQLAGMSPSFAAPASSGITPPSPGMLAGDPLPSSVPFAPSAGASSPTPVLDPEQEELLETVRALRTSGDTAGVLELLKAAEGMDQNSPAVLNEFALTYEQMGLTDKALSYWGRLQNLGSQLGGAYHSMALQRLGGGGQDLLPTPGPSAGLGGLDPATTRMEPAAAGAVLAIGDCQVVKDPAVQDGERRVLRIPIIRIGENSIEPSAVNVDVFFYDLVNGSTVELTRANQPVSTWVGAPVDWAGEGVEPLDVTYFLPELSPEEVKNYGQRSYYGYIVKLYYQNRLQATSAEPAELLQLNQPSGSAAQAPGR